MIFQTKTLYNAAVSADDYSSVIEMLQNTSLSVQVVASGTTVTYTFTLQESNDNVKWANTSTANTLSATSGEQIFFLKLTDAPSKFYRVFIDKNTNNLTSCVITAHAKGI